MPKDYLPLPSPAPSPSPCSNHPASRANPKPSTVKRRLHDPSSSNSSAATNSSLPPRPPPASSFPPPALFIPTAVVRTSTSDPTDRADLALGITHFLLSKYPPTPQPSAASPPLPPPPLITKPSSRSPPLPAPLPPPSLVLHTINSMPTNNPSASLPLLMASVLQTCFASTPSYTPPFPSPSLWHDSLLHWSFTHPSLRLALLFPSAERFNAHLLDLLLTTAASLTAASPPVPVSLVFVLTSASETPFPATLSRRATSRLATATIDAPPSDALLARFVRLLLFSPSATTSLPLSLSGPSLRHLLSNYTDLHLSVSSFAQQAVHLLSLHFAVPGSFAALLHCPPFLSSLPGLMVARCLDYARATEEFVKTCRLPPEEPAADGRKRRRVDKVKIGDIKAGLREAFGDRMQARCGFELLAVAGEWPGGGAEGGLLGLGGGGLEQLELMVGFMER